MSDNFANNSNMTSIMTAIGNKIKAAGHTIYNAAGTALTRRSKLKFTGEAKATDDSVNGQTIVDVSPQYIDWDDWCAMTEQQQAAIPEAVIENAPGVEGGLSADLLTKLWENPDPSQLFAAQDITLSSSDYDLLLTLFITTNTITATSNGVGHSVIVKKGSSISLDCVLPYGGMPAANYYRPMVRNSDTSYSVGACRIGGVSASGSVSFVDSNTSSCIPIAIYGIKKTINLKFSAIASDISTAADHCMLSDGVTSVEDALGATKYKEQSFNITTDSYGIAYFADYPKIIVGAYTDQSAICQFFLNAYRMNYARVISMSGEIMANTNITGVYYYL